MDQVDRTQPSPGVVVEEAAMGVDAAFEEMLGRCGADSERLKIMNEQELKTFSLNVHDEDLLPVPIRCLVLRFFNFTLERTGAQLTKDWFQVVTILDILTARIPMPLKDLPARCAAIISITRKVDTSEFPGLLTRLASHATELAHCLHEMDRDVPAVITEALISHQEQEVLGALGWQVQIASCETWISAFCTRFNVITEGRLHPSVQWISQNSITYARSVCMWQRTSKTVTPRCLAQGIFCISAVMAKLVNYVHLQPEQIEPQEWLFLFGAAPVDVSIEHQVFLNACLVTTDADLATLKRDTHRVLTLISHMHQQG